MYMIIPHNFFWHMEAPCRAWRVLEEDGQGNLVKCAQLLAVSREHAVAIWFLHCRGPFQVLPSWEHN